MILNATSTAVTTFNQLAKRDALQAGLSATNDSAASSSSSTRQSQSDKSASQASTELTNEQKRQVAELQRIDAAVRAHEQAHITAGGSVITSGPNYNYTYGPDGKQYAVSGEVGIDTSPEQKPQANIDKGRLIQRAALAPPDPSPQDLRAASVGGQLEAQGRIDLAAEQAASRAAETEASTPAVDPDSTTSDAATTANASDTGSDAVSRDLLALTYSAGQGASNTTTFSLFA